LLGKPFKNFRLCKTHDPKFLHECRAFQSRRRPITLNRAKDQDSSKIRSLYIKLDEERFYFTKDDCVAFDKIRTRCETFLDNLDEMERCNVSDHGKLTKVTDTLNASRSALKATYDSHPQIFETALKFKQLTESSDIPRRPCFGRAPVSFQPKASRIECRLPLPIVAMRMTSSSSSKGRRLMLRKSVRNAVPFWKIA
jgi:hypothetical protein